MATTEMARPVARLSLPGAGTAAADVEVIYQPRATRVTRAILLLALSWLLMPLVFFIPPHLPWVLLAFLTGLALFFRSLRGAYHVSYFKGACPRCGEPLSLKVGSRIRDRHILECYGCHRRPELVLLDPAG